MTRIARALRKHARQSLPDRQILLRGSGQTRALRLSTARQIIALSGAAICALWLTGATTAAALLWHQNARGAQQQRALQASIASLNAERAALVAQATTLTASRELALAEANAVAAQAALQTRNMARSTSQQIGALNQQTEQAIAQEEGIIRAAGLNPSRLAAALPAPDQLTSRDNAAILTRNLAHLNQLSAALAHIPLAAPLSRLAISSPFGYRADPFTGAREFHVGVDLTGPVGTPVYATAPGIVTYASEETGYGRLIIIDHGYGLSTRYSHLREILVRNGEQVSLHQEIGLMGNSGWSTGPHLLYETRVDGQPENPLTFLKVTENDVQN